MGKGKMPFDFKEYEQRCSEWTKDELHREISRHNDVIATAGAGTGFAVLAIPLTLGLSVIAIGGTGPAFLNARKKRAIVRRYLSLSESLEARQVPELPARSLVELQSAEVSEYSNLVSEEITRENQVYVPVEDGGDIEDVEGEEEGLPSYDEAVLRRRSTRLSRMSRGIIRQRPYSEIRLTNNNNNHNNNNHNNNNHNNNNHNNSRTMRSTQNIHELPARTDDRVHESPASLTRSVSIDSPASPLTPCELEDTSSHSPQNQGLQAEPPKGTPGVPAVLMWQNDKTCELR